MNNIIQKVCSFISFHSTIKNENKNSIYDALFLIKKVNLNKIIINVLNKNHLKKNGNY